MTKRILSLSIVIALLFLSGCSNDPFKKHIGLWERQNINSPKVMEIRRHGESILMTKNVLDYYEDIYGKKIKRKIKPVALNQVNDKLSIAFGPTAFYFGLSNNNETLRVGRKLYNKITIAELDVLNLGFEQRYASNQKKAKLCEGLKSEYKKERALIHKKYRVIYNNKTSNQVKEQLNILKEKSENLIKEFRTKETVIKNCRIWKI